MYTLRLVLFCSATNVALIFLATIAIDIHISLRDLGINFALIYIGLSGIRLLVSQLGALSSRKSVTRVAIYGAGDAGRQLLQALSENRDYQPVLFIDDNTQLHNMRISGVKVYSIDPFIARIDKLDIHLVLVAIPSADNKSLQNIFLRLNTLPVEVKSLPGLAELIDGQVRYEQLRAMSIEDLIGRQPISPVQELMDKNLKDKVVLVSGAGGSIGSQLCREVIKNRAKHLIAFDISEFALYNLMNTLEADKLELGCETELHVVMGSIQNQVYLTQIFRNFGVETVYHAAAYKHVPMVEENIFEGIKNNVFGTLSIAQSALEVGVKNFTLISTDKAVRPTNYMGASKR